MSLPLAVTLNVPATPGSRPSPAHPAEHPESATPTWPIRLLEKKPFKLTWRAKGGEQTKELAQAMITVSREVTRAPTAMLHSFFIGRS